MKTKKRHTAT